MEPDHPPLSEPPTKTPSTDGTPYDSSAVVGAVVLTIFVPLIALIASLILRGSQDDPARKRQLSTWSFAAAGYLVVTGFVVIFFFASLSSSIPTNTKGPCVGGPELGSDGEPLGSGRYRFPCAISGSTVLRLPDGPPTPVAAG